MTRPPTHTVAAALQREPQVIDVTPPGEAQTAWLQALAARLVEDLGARPAQCTETLAERLTRLTLRGAPDDVASARAVLSAALGDQLAPGTVPEIGYPGVPAVIATAGGSLDFDAAGWLDTLALPAVLDLLGGQDAAEAADAFRDGEVRDFYIGYIFGEGPNEPDGNAPYTVTLDIGALRTYAHMRFPELEAAAMARVQAGECNPLDPPRSRLGAEQRDLLGPALRFAELEIDRLDAEIPAARAQPRLRGGRYLRFWDLEDERTRWTEVRDALRALEADTVSA